MHVQQESIQQRSRNSNLGALLDLNRPGFRGGRLV